MRRLLCASAVRHALVAIRRAMSAPMTGFEFGIAAPRPQIGLLDHVLGIVCRTEHPVTVREQLTAERLGVAEELAHAAAGRWELVTLLGRDPYDHRSASGSGGGAMPPM